MFFAVGAEQCPQHFAANQRRVTSKNKDVAVMLAELRLADAGGVAGAELLGLLDPLDPLVAFEVRNDFVLAMAHHQQHARNQPAS